MALIKRFFSNSKTQIQVPKESIVFLPLNRELILEEIIKERWHQRPILTFLAENANPPATTSIGQTARETGIINSRNR
jgi:hypothetical protein